MAKKKTVEKEKQTEKLEIKVENVNVEELAIPALKDYYQKNVESFKERVSKINDEDELKSVEDELMKEFDENDRIIENRAYELPSEITFNQRRLTVESIGRIIGALIGKMEVEYRMTLGMWQLWRWWKTPEKKIGYGAYDSTVRILGSLKYKGPNEWENLLAVIEFLKGPNDMYTRDILRQDYLAQKHNELLNRMDLIAGHTAAADALEGLPYTPTKENMPAELKK